MSALTSGSFAPVLYLPHGGGPLPLLGDMNHSGLVAFLKTITKKLGKPEAILIISAHWETDCASITSAISPPLIYDYSGFPAESYEIQYPAAGAPLLATEIYDLLTANDINTRLDDQRGFDHGMFVPLKLMYPDATIPCVQLSLLKSLDPAAHIAMGKALSPLRKKNILIIGSGMSYHNLRTFFTDDAKSLSASEEFDSWLRETCVAQNTPTSKREHSLIDWTSAPSARFCHPREEHLLPLHVCYGIACTQTPVAQLVFNELVMGKKVSSLLWQ